MHKLSAYEHYLIGENLRYGCFPGEDNEYPEWLIEERITYNWIFHLDEMMRDTSVNRAISRRLQSIIDNIGTLECRKYESVSPTLKNSLEEIVAELIVLNSDLKNPEMWKHSNCLSGKGLTRWRHAFNVVDRGRYAEPDPIWRENWEKEKSKPYCTRREAEMLAIDYVNDHYGIDLTEIDGETEKGIYYHGMSAKSGVFKMRFGKWERLPGEAPDINMGVIKVDMLTRKIEEIK